MLLYLLPHGSRVNTGFAVAGVCCLFVSFGLCAGILLQQVSTNNVLGGLNKPLFVLFTILTYPNRGSKKLGCPIL